MEALRVEHLSKYFGGVRALHDVSFSVEAGEKLALIGPNGAGKTTLFNVLNGQLKPDAGRIYFFGQDITYLSPYKRAHLGQARSFQMAALFPSLTVMENMLLALQGTKSSRFQMLRLYTGYNQYKAKAQKLLEFMNIWDKKDEVVGFLSHGEQKKLEIALSFAPEPKLLQLDEPSSGLTAAESADIAGLIRSLGSNMTVIFVAHDMDLVFGLAERIVVLHYGQIIAEGTCEQIGADKKVKEIYMGIEETRGNARTG